MDPRLTLHEMLSEVFDPGEAHLYFQPPENVKLVYPCIVYKLDGMPPVHANNSPYHLWRTYQLTVVDRDPNSIIRERVALLPSCRFVQSFVSDNLNHYVFKINV